MTKENGLPPNVHIKHGRYWLVRRDDGKRLWTKLTLVRLGLPAMFKALAKETERPGNPHLMPAIIADWETKVMPRHAKTTQRDDARYNALIAEAFPDIQAGDIEPPDAVAFLDQWEDKPRTYNAIRSQFFQIMRYAEKYGHIKAGANPISSIETMRVKARDRYITDSELRRIKVAAIYYRDKMGRTHSPETGERYKTRSGFMLCALIDVAVLTGQRIADLLSLEWAQVSEDGIAFEQGKTGAKVLVQMSPRLADAIRRLKELRVKRRAFGGHVFTTQDGKPYSYGGARAAWRRALKRAGIPTKTTHFHDLRAKAGTDIEESLDLKAARRLLGHTTEQQTSAYLRNKRAQKARPSG